MVTNETISIIEKFILRLEESIQIGIDENCSPNDMDYNEFKEKSFTDNIRYVVEKLSQLEEDYCNCSIRRYF
jgi:hypothetical protein